MEQGARVNVWYDAAGDFLDVTWERDYGYFTPTQDDRVMVRVAMDGRRLGFKIEEISSLTGRPLRVKLAPQETAAPVQV